MQNNKYMTFSGFSRMLMLFGKTRMLRGRDRVPVCSRIVFILISLKSATKIVAFEPIWRKPAKLIQVDNV
jgi:hypothetical protein